MPAATYPVINLPGGRAASMLHTPTPSAPSSRRPSATNTIIIPSSTTTINEADGGAIGQSPISPATPSSSTSPLHTLAHAADVTMKLFKRRRSSAAAAAAAGSDSGHGPHRRVSPPRAPAPLVIIGRTIPQEWMYEQAEGGIRLPHMISPGSSSAKAAASSSSKSPVPAAVGRPGTSSTTGTSRTSCSATESSCSSSSHLRRSLSLSSFTSGSCPSPSCRSSGVFSGPGRRGSSANVYSSGSASGKRGSMSSSSHHHASTTNTAARKTQAQQIQARWLADQAQSTTAQQQLASYEGIRRQRTYTFGGTVPSPYATSSTAAQHHHHHQRASRQYPPSTSQTRRHFVHGDSLGGRPASTSNSASTSPGTAATYGAFDKMVDRDIRRRASEHILQASSMDLQALAVPKELLPLPPVVSPKRPPPSAPAAVAGDVMQRQQMEASQQVPVRPALQHNSSFLSLPRSVSPSSSMMSDLDDDDDEQDPRETNSWRYSSQTSGHSEVERDYANTISAAMRLSASSPEASPVPTPDTGTFPPRSAVTPLSTTNSSSTITGQTASSPSAPHFTNPFAASPTEILAPVTETAVLSAPRRTSHALPPSPLGPASMAQQQQQGYTPPSSASGHSSAARRPSHASIKVATSLLHARSLATKAERELCQSFQNSFMLDLGEHGAIPLGSAVAVATPAGVAQPVDPFAHYSIAGNAPAIAPVLLPPGSRRTSAGGAPWI